MAAILKAGILPSARESQFWQFWQGKEGLLALL
jgi:hypothetical protein